MSSFLGTGSSSHHRHRSRSPARSVVPTKTGDGAFVRPHASRSKSEPEAVFVRRRSSRSSSGSRSRSRDRGGLAGIFGLGGDGERRRSSQHYRSKSPGVLGSFLGIGDTRHGHSQSRSRSRAQSTGVWGGLFGGNTQRRDRSPQSVIGSFFGGNRHYSSTSRYNRRSRDGLLQKIMNVIRKLWRDLRRYAKNNPVKMVTLVLMPLLTSGILVKVLAGMGIRLPASISKLAGGGGGGNNEPQRMSGGYYGSQGYGGPPEPQGAGGIGGTGIGLKEVMGVAKLFM